ncbi:MAG: hypothetical protein ACHQNV_10865 [Vicinamibacteria bacterium]
MNSQPKHQPTVPMPRGLVIALLSALAVSVLAVAFLLGRETGRGQPAQPPSTVTERVAASVPPAPGVATPAPTAQLPASVAQGEVPLPGTPIAGPLAPAVSTTTPSAGRDPLRDAVAAYFGKVEAIQSRAKSWSDPEALARSLLEQGSRGDVSGFDGLAAANAKVRDELRAVEVPEPCREHHRMTLALIDESVSMLERVKSQLQGSDAGSLGQIAESAHDLERKAKDVDAQAAEIKRRFGL